VAKRIFGTYVYKGVTINNRKGTEPSNQHFYSNIKSASLGPLRSLFWLIQVVVQQFLASRDVSYCKDANPVVTVDHQDFGTAIRVCTARHTTWISALHTLEMQESMPTINVLKLKSKAQIQKEQEEANTHAWRLTKWGVTCGWQSEVCCHPCEHQSPTTDSS